MPNNNDKKRMGRRMWSGIGFAVLVTVAFYVMLFAEAFDLKAFQFYCATLMVAVIIVVPSLTLTDLLPTYWDKKNSGK